jgi:hypothetical protein
MDFDAANAYMIAWTKSEHSTPAALKVHGKEAFSGRFGSLNASFSDGTLLITGTVNFDAHTYVERPKLLDYLNQYSQRDASIRDFHFEAFRGPWQMIDKPGLYLVWRVSQANLTEAEFINKCKALRDRSFSWSRVELPKFLNDAPPEAFSK